MQQNLQLRRNTDAKIIDWPRDEQKKKKKEA